MIVRQLFLFLPLLMATSASALDTLDGKQILAKMSFAMHTLNFQGTVAFFRSGQLEPMQYRHAVSNHLEQERLISLNSPLREITRDLGQVTTLYRSTGRKVFDNRPFERSFLVDLPDNINEIDAHYLVNVISEETIALLPTYVVALKSKDALRYSKTLWVDKNSFLPIKSNVLDFSNNVLEEMVFTNLEIKEKLDFITQPPNQPTQSTPSDANKALDAFKTAPFTADNLPSGFHLLYFSRRNLQNSEEPVDHLIIGDGLSSVSIYLEHAKDDNNPDYQSTGVETIGSINFYSTPLDTYSLTVLGEVPKETIALIAQGIKLKNR